MTNTNNATAANVGPCADCNSVKPLDARGLCRFCAEEIAICPSDAADIMAARAAAAAPVVEALAMMDATSAMLGAPIAFLPDAPPIEVDQAPLDVLVSELTAVAADGAANAAVQGIGSLHGGELRGVGFSTKEGYITALRNGVKAATHALYFTTLRTMYGLTSADLAALELPGPMAETALPNGAGIKHVPTGPSVFDLPRAERQFRVSAPEAVKEVTRKLDRSDLIAGSVAEGHGVLVCWSGAQKRGFRSSTKISRGTLVAALETIGRADIAPNAKSAHAQAGRAVQSLVSYGRGYDVKAATRESCPELQPGQCRWTVGKVNHAGAVGEEYGTIALTVTLTDGELTFDGDQVAADLIRADFNARTAGDIYQGADVTLWLGSILRRKHAAVEYGMGWYVPATHRTAAAALCAAISATGFGTSWVGGSGRPALPIATCDELRDGILRGLTEEVETLIDRLATEREAAKTARKTGDIGEKRAGTFLGELREITRRIDAYGQMMGAERVAAAREQVRLAIVELETVLGDDYTGIGARFALIADECAFDKTK